MRTFRVFFRKDFGGVSFFVVKGRRIAIHEVSAIEGYKSLSFAWVLFSVDNVELFVYDLVKISENGVEDKIIDVYDRGKLNV